MPRHTRFDPLPRALDPLRALAPATDRTSDARFVDWIVATAYDRSHAAHAEVVRTIEPILTAYYPSQFFQAAAEGLALIALMSLAWLAPRKAGVVSSIFLAGYGILRYTTEHFREPDPGVAMLGGLTLPMLLSLAMLVAGVVLFALSRRSRPIGGLVWKTDAHG
jgi:prolipoprotein diacylglyceryltransferase